VSKDLKWDKQCSQAVKKANRMLGVIKRNFTDRSKETIMPLYKSVVRPHLEYCVPIWSPHYQKDIELVEGVQRRATELIDDVRNLHYEERIKKLNLMTLEKRRHRSDLIETFKIINNCYNLKSDLFFMMKV